MMMPNGMRVSFSSETAEKIFTADMEDRVVNIARNYLRIDWFNIKSVLGGKSVPTLFAKRAFLLWLSIPHPIISSGGQIAVELFLRLDEKQKSKILHRAFPGRWVNTHQHFRYGF